MSLAPDSVNNQSVPEDREYLSINEYVGMGGAARRYDVSERTIRRLIAEGDLPAYRVGRQIRIRVADLDALATPIPAA